MNAYIGSINNVLRSLIIYYIQILDENDEDITAAIAEGISAAIVDDVSNDIGVDADDAPIYEVTSDDDDNIVYEDIAEMMVF